MQKDLGVIEMSNRYKTVMLGLCVVLGACGTDTSLPTATTPNVDEQPAIAAASSDAVNRERVELIYENNPEESTSRDGALVLALLNLGEEASDQETLRTAANALLGQVSISGSIEVPTGITADYAETAGQLDLRDVAVVLAAARPLTTPLTETVLANAATALLSSTVLAAEDIRAIPGVSVPAPFSDRQLELLPPAQTLTPGATFSIALNLTEAEGLRGLDAEISYDPDLLKATSVDEGELVRANGLTLVSSPLSENRGVVSAIAFRAEPIPSSTSGTVMTIQFEVAADAPAGTTELSLSGALNEGNIATQLNGSSITISP